MDPVLGTLILFFITASAGCLIYLHLLPTGLNPLHSAVSAYGAGRYRFWYQAMSVCQALAAFLLAYTLATKVTPAPFTTDAALVALGLARLVIVRAPMDLHGHKPTKHGQIHALMAVIIFTAAAVAAVSFSHVANQDANWSNVAGTLRLLKDLVVVFTIIFAAKVIVPAGPRYRGALQRLLYISIIAWFVAVAFHLL